MTKDDWIAAAYDPETTAALCHVLADSLRAHLQQVQSAKGSVSIWHDPADNIAAADLVLQQAGGAGDLDSIAQRFEQLVGRTLRRGQNLNHPHYIGHQVPAPLPFAGLFDALASITNQVQGVYEMGPWAVSAERAVIERLGETIGFVKGTFGGLVTSGGSLGNLTALLTVRNKVLSDSWKTGVGGGDQKPVIVAHADAHYCVDRAAGVMGIGTDQVIRVPLDSDRRIDVAELDRMLTDLRNRSVPIIAVVAVAGSTPVGAFDPLEEIRDACDRHRVWMHVDAAHGGAVCFSEMHRHLVSGLQLADSVVLDAHKMMFMPALCAFVFYKNRDDRFAAFQQSAPYLFDPSSPDMAEYDNGVVTMECTKRAAVLGLWGVWSIFGSRLFQQLVDRVFATARELHQQLSDDEEFSPYCLPTSNIVVFRYQPSCLRGDSAEDIDQLQLQLRRQINRGGDAYLTQTIIDGRVYLRSTIMNPLTDGSHLRAILQALRRCGQAETGITQ